MITTIIFDLNLTLVATQFDDPERVYENKIGVSKENVYIAGFKNWDGFETGIYGEAEFIHRVCEDLHLPPNLEPLLTQMWHDDFYLLEGMDQVLARLQGKYRLLLLAGDGDEFLHVKLDKFNLKRFFSGIYCTCYEGMRKKDPEIYRRLLAKENISATECLYIDDQPNLIQNAQNVGMNVILFKNSEQLRRDLENFSIFI